eukprot:1210579-Pyramimonas_sp.AAC.1
MGLRRSDTSCSSYAFHGTRADPTRSPQTLQVSQLHLVLMSLRGGMFSRVARLPPPPLLRRRCCCRHRCCRPCLRES